jgi:cyanate permease
VREIYGLSTHARARMNSVYMTCVFLGGAAASAATGPLLNAAGWSGVMGLAAGLVALGSGIWLWEAATARARQSDRDTAPEPSSATAR